MKPSICPWGVSRVYISQVFYVFSRVRSTPTMRRHRGSPVPGIALVLVLFGGASFLQAFSSLPPFDGSREHDHAVLQQELVNSGQAADFHIGPLELERQYLEMERRGYFPSVAPPAPITTPLTSENT